MNNAERTLTCILAGYGYEPHTLIMGEGTPILYPVHMTVPELYCRIVEIVKFNEIKKVAVDCSGRGGVLFDYLIEGRDRGDFSRSVVISLGSYPTLTSTSLVGSVVIKPKPESPTEGDGVTFRVFRNSPDKGEGYLVEIDDGEPVGGKAVVGKAGLRAMRNLINKALGEDEPSTREFIGSVTIYLDDGETVYQMATPDGKIQVMNTEEWAQASTQTIQSIIRELFTSVGREGGAAQ